MFHIYQRIELKYQERYKTNKKEKTIRVRKKWKKLKKGTEIKKESKIEGKQVKKEKGKIYEFKELTFY